MPVLDEIGDMARRKICMSIRLHAWPVNTPPYETIDLTTYEYEPFHAPIMFYLVR